MRAWVLIAAGLAAGGAAADPVVPEAEHCVVGLPAGDVLNLREGPGTEFPIMTGLPPSQCGVMVTGDCQGSWCPVEDGHYAGWAHRRYLSMVSPAMYCVTRVADDDVLNLRAWPSASSRILARLGPHLCDIAILPFAVGDWQKVRADGWEGWVRRSYLSGE